MNSRTRNKLRRNALLLGLRCGDRLEFGDAAPESVICAQTNSIEPLFAHIRRYHVLSEEARDALESSFQRLEGQRSEFLIREGKTCRQLYFLEEGAIRGFYQLEGKEITHWFTLAPDFFTSFHSFITATPAVEHIQLMEPSVLWSISKERLSALMQRFHEIERIVRIAYEEYYIRLEERFINAQFKTATERYRELLERSPQVIERVSLGYIASYLGISPETLSRVRAKI